MTLFKQRGEWNLEVRQEPGGQGFVRFPRKLCGPDLPLVGQPIDFDGLQLGVHDPVFTHSLAFIEFAFHDLVGSTVPAERISMTRSGGP